MNWHSLLGLVPITVIAVTAFIAQMREQRREGLHEGAGSKPRQRALV